MTTAFALALGCGGVACKKPEKGGGSSEAGFSLPNPFAEKPKVAYPIERVISDQQGRPMEAVIIGRSGTELFAVRKSDNYEFTIPIASLAQADRDYVNTLPIEAAPSGFGKADEKKKASESHPYVEFRQKEIAKLREKISLLTKEYEASTNTMIKSSRENEIKRAEAEIARLQASIDRYKIDNGLK